MKVRHLQNQQRAPSFLAQAGYLRGLNSSDTSSFEKKTADACTSREPVRLNVAIAVQEAAYLKVYTPPYKELIRHYTSEVLCPGSEHETLLSSSSCGDFSNITKSPIYRHIRSSSSSSSSSSLLTIEGREQWP